MFLHSFSLNHGFIPLGFSGKVFNETYYDTKGCCTHFPSLRFFPIEFFLGKVLIRHILDRHLRGSVTNIPISGCPPLNLPHGCLISLTNFILINQLNNSIF